MTPTPPPQLQARALTSRSITFPPGETNDVAWMAQVQALAQSGGRAAGGRWGIGLRLPGVLGKPAGHTAKGVPLLRMHAQLITPQPPLPPTGH